ncbi:hypothetical protein J7E81_22055 [Bacillus sp. ISL-18]|uniref:hypothetical protein n=1 Tax=Bacillus sp. ISL-18 TaxID=2819118 RepID=UPI001BE4FD3E|nr:hypothetical protein [Bacillus sp. ISL-18]MBT2657890.1 hypothetical protein [Bacillus sp. ISL-18]
MDNITILMFIGEMISSQEIRITRKPSLYDAFLLSDESFPATPPSLSESYQSIPLVQQASLLIHIQNYQIVLSYQQSSLQITKTGEILSEEEVLEVFTNFIVRVADKVSYLSTSPYRKKRSQRKKKQRILAVEKKLEVSRN